MTINTIVTDMDDTLFNEESKISEYTFSVVKECLRRGIRFIPASGRAQASMEPYMKQLDTKLPYIACNGAQLVNADHSVKMELLMPAEVARQVCAFWQENGCYVQMYYGRNLYYANECDYSTEYKKDSKMHGIAVGDLVKFITDDPPKLLGIGDPALIAKLYEASSEKFEGQVVFSISKPYFLECVPLGATKGIALELLAKDMNICPESTMVFGDSLNDISMLEYTSNSVAMGNARDEVKQKARYVCGRNGEDGLAHFIQEHVLSAHSSAN